MSNKRLRAALAVLASIGIVLAIVFYLYANADRYVGLLRLSAPRVAALLLLAMTFPVLNGAQNTLLYRSLGVRRFSQRDGFLIAAASTLANQLPLPGGMLSKAIYLKRMHGLAYTLYLSSTVALFLCYVSLQGLVGLAALLYLAYTGGNAPSAVLWIGFASMSACPILLWLPLGRLGLPPLLEDRLQKAIDGWIVVARDPIMLMQTLGVQLVIVLLLAVRYWLAFGMLSQDVSFAQVFLMSNASILTQLVTLVPGGLGVREAIVGSVSWTLGFDAAVSVAAVGLDRLVSTIATLLLGGASAMILGRQMTAAAIVPGHRGTE